MPTYSALTTLAGQGRRRGACRGAGGSDARTHRRRRVRDRGRLGSVGGRGLFPRGAGRDRARRLLAMAFEAQALRAVGTARDRLGRQGAPRARARSMPAVSSSMAATTPTRCPTGAHRRCMIEATVAFGTGHHGTTLGCLRALDRHGRPRRSGPECGGHRLRHGGAGDGCGAGVSRTPSTPRTSTRSRWMSPVANAEINGLADRVIAWKRPGFDHPGLQAAAPFDLVFANILKGPLIELAPSMARPCRAGARRSSRACWSCRPIRSLPPMWHAGLFATGAGRHRRMVNAGAAQRLSRRGVTCRIAQ